jgi:hypothetical protein
MIRVHNYQHRNADMLTQTLEAESGTAGRTCDPALCALTDPQTHLKEPVTGPRPFPLNSGSQILFSYVCV